jgi:dipeptidase E
MKYYLSSYQLGKETNKLKEQIKGTNGKFGYIFNALDFTGVDPIRRDAHIQSDVKDLAQYGATVEVIDLKEYFGKAELLKVKVATLGGLYVSGGNTFVLRQAMALSGLDQIILGLRTRSDFLYIGYSAGVCVLTPSLRPYAITDDADNFPYKEIAEQIWEGLNILPYTFEPHYQSDHPESASTDQEIAYCIEQKIPFVAYRDGEVLVIE